VAEKSILDYDTYPALSRSTRLLDAERDGCLVKSRSISRQPRRKVARRGARWRAGKVPVKRSSRVRTVSAALFIYGGDAGLLAEQAAFWKAFSDAVWKLFSRRFSNRAQPLKNPAVTEMETA
jgi:hypothetical protein